MRYFLCFYRTRFKFISWKVTISQFKSVHVICNYVEFFHATCVNTTVCSCILISLFYIAVAFLFAFTSCYVSGRTGGSLDHLALVSRRLKSLCQFACQKNKKIEVKRLFTTFFSLLLLRYVSRWRTILYCGKLSENRDTKRCAEIFFLLDF